MTEERPHQQAIPQQIAPDDPLAFMDLPPLTQISEFWKRYDRLADIHDKKMTSNLNGNLDVLLIFAALFSAINTAFISITMPNLYPNPSDETNNLLRLLVMRADNNTLTPADLSPAFSPNSNSIVVNGLLYASLSCSLLAAVGAMMAKEWLQSFDRTGQTGPLEQQGQFRQRKFNGVEQWHLEAVIKFLPNLLLLSVALFFAGIILFLVPINIAVAGIVIAFSGVGGIFSGAAIVAGATSFLCPYQSAASNALRRAAGAFRSSWGTIKPTAVHPMIRSTWSRVSSVTHRLRWHSVRPFRLPPPINSAMDFLGSIFRTSPPSETGPQAPHPSSSRREGREADQQLVNAQAACWLLETTSDRGDQVSAAQFIPTLDKAVCALVFLEDTRAWRRFVTLTKEAFEAWQSQPTQRNQYVAELFGVALLHVPLPFSPDAVRDGNDAELSIDQSESRGDIFLQALDMVSSKYPNHKPQDEECLSHIAVLTTMISNGFASREYQWVNPAKLLLDCKTPDIAETFLGLWAIVVYSVIARDGNINHTSRIPEKIMQIGEDKQTFIANLSAVIYYGDSFILSVRENSQSELNARRGYLACLRKALELSLQTSPPYLSQTALGVSKLIRNYVDPLMASDAGETGPELVRFVVEAALGLHTLFRVFNDLDPQGSYRPNYSTDRGLFSATLIDAVADMMADDFKFMYKILWEQKPIRPSLTRILLWVWKNTSDTPTSKWQRNRLFDSTCRLWTSWEREVDFSKTGDLKSYDKPLTADDQDRIIEFIEFVKKDRKCSAFISRNADVGINRLYAHFEQRVEWEYQLFDIREQRKRCSRSEFIGDGLP